MRVSSGQRHDEAAALLEQPAAWHPKEFALVHDDSTPPTTETITTDQDACVFPLGEDAGLAFATIWDDTIEIQLKVPAEATRYQYIDRERAAALHAWLGAWLAAHPEARP